MTTPPKDPRFPPIPTGLSFPFYYGLLSLFWVFYRVDANVLEPHLEGTGLKPALFDGQGAVSIGLQNYAAHISIGVPGTNEIEFNIISYPASRESQVPSMSLTDWIRGDDITKTIGGFRLWVPCDNPHAIEAGIRTFGERKFPAAFDYKVPSLNDPAQVQWSYSCLDPIEAGDPQKKIYSVEADIQQLQPVVANASSLVLYSLLPGGPDHPPGNGRLICSRWDVFGTYQTYCDLIQQAQEKIKLSYGTSEKQMRKDMESIIGNTPPAAVRVYQSPPVASESSAFYVDL